MKPRERACVRPVGGVDHDRADGLAAAHERGLIHRDVKPQNIMIDTSGKARLTDFGVVKALSAPALTQSGMTFGTAAYLSPEQATGAPIGPASDVYALGCVMYELLAGTTAAVNEKGCEAMKYSRVPASAADTRQPIPL